MCAFESLNEGTGSRFFANGIERVWERAHDYDTKLIEIYIGRLRKKIDEGSTQPLIKTVRHLGYAVRSDSSA